MSNLSKILYFVLNTSALIIIALLYRFDTRPIELAKLNEHMDYTHYELCSQSTEYDRPDTIFNLIKYDADFMANFTSDITLEISNYEDVIDFINSRKVEGSSYTSSYINRSLWQYIEYSIKDKESLEDYWKIKYYCTLNIGRCNYTINTECKFEEFILFKYMYIITGCIFIIIFTNVYAVMIGLFRKGVHKNG